ncbi:MAG: MerR family transcriptional regulator [Patescibacteria group bacterium]|nr:MerR family transcriptional regulator [Patescibacteria group bacterium]
MLDINKTAKMLGLNPKTLRRWDNLGKLNSVREKKGAHRYYNSSDAVDFLRKDYKYMFKVAYRWTLAKNPPETFDELYCRDKFVFKARLSSLANLLQKQDDPQYKFPLLIAMIGEIGNNSFDHNIGNWPNLPGIFFGYCLKSKEIIIADRGRGVLKTLKVARPTLKNDAQALKVAFTEIISGRQPENRGNGLKFVRRNIVSQDMCLVFQSGVAQVQIDKKNDLKIVETKKNLKGCLATIKY